MRALWLVSWVFGTALLLGSAGAAEERPGERLSDRHPELYSAFYGFSVCEYCGLVTPEVHDGFNRQTAALIAESDLSEETVRAIRIRAWTDADLEWGNRGLGGFRGWCRTEGAEAARRFIAFRAEDMAAGQEEAR